MALCKRVSEYILSATCYSICDDAAPPCRVPNKPRMSELINGLRTWYQRYNEERGPVSNAVKRRGGRGMPGTLSQWLHDAPWCPCIRGYKPAIAHRPSQG